MAKFDTMYVWNNDFLNKYSVNVHFNRRQNRISLADFEDILILGNTPAAASSSHISTYSD